MPVTLKKVLDALGSLKLTVGLLAATLVLIFAATLDQAAAGIAHAQKAYLESWWGPWPIMIPGGLLIGLLGLFNLMAASVRHFQGKGLALLFLHAGVALLILSAFVAGATRQEWTLWLDSRQRSDVVVREEPLGAFRLPFEVQLKKFSFERYPGTDIPKAFVSDVVIFDKGADVREASISMNQPLRYRDFTLYQASFDAAHPGRTGLMVVRNPASALPYVAVGLITLGLLWHFVRKFFWRSR